MNWIGWVIISVLVIIFILSVLFFLWSREFRRDSKKLWDDYHQFLRDHPELPNPWEEEGE